MSFDMHAVRGVYNLNHNMFLVGISESHLHMHGVYPTVLYSCHLALYMHTALFVLHAPLLPKFYSFIIYLHFSHTYLRNKLWAGLTLHHK